MPTPYQFTTQNLVDIRRFCGYPLYGTGTIVFPFPWWFKYYEAMEVRLQNMLTEEANVLFNTYLTPLYTLESAIPGAGANLDTDAAGPWTHNKEEVQDRTRLFDSWRRRLCGFLGIPAGPYLSSGNQIRLVV